MPSFKTEKLIQHLYQETQEDAQIFEEVLMADLALSEKFRDLKRVTRALDNLLESPRPQSVMAILDYAKQSAFA